MPDEATAAGRFAKRVRGYIPSRGWLLFLGSVGAISSYYMYDRHKLKQIQKELELKAAVIAQEPMIFYHRARHVVVYLSPTIHSKDCFEEFVKPVFDAGALDYTIPDNTTTISSIRDSVAESIWTGKDEHLQDLTRRRLEQQQKSKPSLLSRIFSSSSKTTTPSVIEEAMRNMMVKYRAEDGIVCVGPEAWGAVLKGLQMGVWEERPPPPPAPAISSDDGQALAGVKEKDSDVASVEAISPPSSQPLSSTPQPNDKQEALLSAPKSGTPTQHPELSASLPLPPLGYISSQNQTGWSTLPLRIYRWFNKRHTMSIVGEEALKIVYGQVRDFEAPDPVVRGAGGMYFENQKHQQQEAEGLDFDEMTRYTGGDVGRWDGDLKCGSTPLVVGTDGWKGIDASMVERIKIYK